MPAAAAKGSPAPLHQVLQRRRLPGGSPSWVPCWLPLVAMGKSGDAGGTEVSAHAAANCQMWAALHAPLTASDHRLAFNLRCAPCTQQNGGRQGSDRAGNFAAACAGDNGTRPRVGELAAHEALRPCLRSCCWMRNKYVWRSREAPQDPPWALRSWSIKGARRRETRCAGGPKPKSHLPSMRNVSGGGPGGFKAATCALAGHGVNRASLRAVQHPASGSGGPRIASDRQ